MFNFSPPPVPGFRFRPPQDYVPGFNIEENGLPPGDRTWSDGAQPGSAMPQGVTPVNCTTADGRLDCSSPRGIKFNNIPATDFPGRLAPDSSRHYHRYSTPDGPYSDSARTMEKYIIDRPTAGPRNMVRPATPEGTLNEATPELVYKILTEDMQTGPFGFLSMRRPGTLISPVKSYLTTDQNGKQIVVNVTEPGHPLHPGYVVRYVTPSDSGPIIQNEGEGAGRMQGPIGQNLPLPLPGWNLADRMNDVWRGLYQKHLDASRP